MTVQHLPVHEDGRGRLVVAEEAAVGFPIRRVFAITGSPPEVTRGEHTVPCRQTMILVTGAATVWTADGGDDDQTEHHLEQSGDTLELASGTWVRYRLSGPEAVVVVLADAPFTPRAENAS